MSFVPIKNCPIHVGFYHSCIGKKWTLTIVRDIMFGMRKFSDFLKTNSDLSSKVLAERLKELERENIIEKRVFGSSPTIIEYHLTQKGMDLNQILYSLSIFGAKYHTEEVFGTEEVPFNDAVEVFAKGFRLDNKELEFQKTPVVVTRQYIDAPLEFES